MFRTTAANVPTSTPRATDTAAPTATSTPLPTATATEMPCTSSPRQCAERKQLQIGVKFATAWFPDDKWRGIVGREFNLAVMAAGLAWWDVEVARQVDPSAVLIYNDTQNYAQTSLTTELTRQIARRLKAKGLINGVGLEMQINGNQPPSEQDVMATIKGAGRRLVPQDLGA